MSRHQVFLLAVTNKTFSFCHLLIFGSHLRKLFSASFQSRPIGTIDNPDETLCLLKIVFPKCPDWFLPSYVPDIHLIWLKTLIFEKEKCCFSTWESPSSSIGIVSMLNPRVGSITFTSLPEENFHNANEGFFLPMIFLTIVVLPAPSSPRISTRISRSSSRNFRIIDKRPIFDFLRKINEWNQGRKWKMFFQW